MKAAAMGMVGVLMLTAGFSAQKVSRFSVRNDETFTGEIMDSFCAEDGHHIGVIKSERNTTKAGCTLTCVKLAGAQFVLYDSETDRVYKLDDQQQPEAFAGQKVIVTGKYDKDANAIQVIHIRPMILYAGLWRNKFLQVVAPGWSGGFERSIEKKNVGTRGREVQDARK